MARIRTIKPDFWTDETVVELDYGDRLFFIGLWNFADDQGFLDYRPKRIKMQVFPGDNYDVVEGLARLHEASLVSLYTSESGLIVYINGWDKHQKISNPAKERYSLPDLDFCENFMEAVQSPLESSALLRKGRERKGKERSESRPRETDPQNGFDDFWDAYPRRTDKGHARKAFTTALKKVDAPTIVGAAASFAVTCNGSDPKFIPHPSTWLNGERWSDETLTPTTVATYQPDVLEEAPPGMSPTEYAKWEREARERQKANT